MINPSIKDIRNRYLELINLLNDDSQDIETIRVCAAALSTIIYAKYSILENESIDDPKKKMVTNKTINALKSSNEPFDFTTVRLTVE